METDKTDKTDRANFYDKEETGRRNSSSKNESKILNGELCELFLLVSCRFWLLPHFRLWRIDLSALRSLAHLQ